MCIRDSLSVASFKECDLSESQIAFSKLDYVNFSSATLNSALLIKVSGIEADLSGALLNGAIMQRVELTKSKFDNAEMNGVEDDEAVFDESSFEGTAR